MATPIPQMTGTPSASVVAVAHSTQFGGTFVTQSIALGLQSVGVGLGED